MIAGGVGHSTKDLWDNVQREPQLAGIDVEGRPEADILSDILVTRHGIPRSAVLIENKSTNCGANAWEAKRVLQELDIHPASMLLIQDPTMQRRTHVSFKRAWRGETPVQFVSFAPFIPVAQTTDSGDWTVEPAAWSQARFMSLLLGEIPRLSDSPDGYGPLGKDFIEHVDIPDEVYGAWERLEAAHGALTRTAS